MGEIIAELADCTFAMLGVLILLFAVLGTGCAIADFLFPRIPPLARWIDNLPEYEDEEEQA